MAEPAQRAWGSWWLLPMGLVGLVAATFAQVVTFDFVEMDDFTYVVNNPHLTQGLTLESARWAFTETGYTAWIPLTWLSHLVDISLFGAWPGGHHLTSALIHLANTFLAVVVLRRLKVDDLRSVIITALVMLHPTRAESVAWVAERKDVLCLFFTLVTLLAWTWYLGKPSARRYVVVAAAFALALMSKAMAMTLPVLLLIVDVAIGRFGDVRRCLREKVPLFFMAAAVAVVAVKTQSARGAVQTLANLPLTQRLETVPLALTRYFENTFWPTRLCAYYPRFVPTTGQWVTATCAGVLLAATLWGLRRRLPGLGLGVGWMVVSLLPVIGLLQAGGQLCADRYLYLAHFGLMSGLVLSVPSAWVARYRLGVTVAVGALIAGSAALTYGQLSMWRDSPTLFRDTLLVEPDNDFTRTSLGIWLLKHGQVDEALPLLSEAATRFPFAQSVLGLALVAHGQVPQGVEQLETAQARSPTDEGIRRQLVLGLNQAVAAAEANGRTVERDSWAARVKQLTEPDAGTPVNAR